VQRLGGRRARSLTKESAHSAEAVRFFIDAENRKTTTLLTWSRCGGGGSGAAVDGNATFAQKCKLYGGASRQI